MKLWSADKSEQMEIRALFKTFKSLISAKHFQSSHSSIAKGNNLVYVYQLNSS